MNIFILDENLKTSAEKLFELDPVRARKQIVELTQMLACCVDVELKKSNGDVYKTPKSICNHPATIWVRANISYCIQYLQELIFAYGKPHGCDEALAQLLFLSDFRGDVNLGWHTKKVTAEELLGRVVKCNADICEANTLYIKEKLKGNYKN